MRNRVELLAPAGGEGALRAAVAAGADAVYLGADRFSARSGAENFSLKNLGRYIDYCHVRGVKVHLAANTLVKEYERKEFLHYVTEAYNMGIDAVIIQDLGMAVRIKEALPDLALHASTQMTVSTAEGVRALEKLGYERVVLARELTKREISEIRAATKAELEVFVHGALCWCYSGQCLMSSVIGRRSGNRGMCAQPCRLPYSLIKNGNCQKNGYLMSPRDLCLADDIGYLCDIGIDSFKIEGRLKSEQYVATAVGVYRKCIDGAHLSEKDRAALLGAFNRSGFTQGWYGGAKNFMSGDTPSNIAKNEISPEYARFVADGEIRKIGVNIFAELKCGEPLSVTLIDTDGNAASAEGEICAEWAVNKPLDKERLAAQLSKLGASCFEAETCEISIDDNIALPIGEINAVRREVCRLLEEKRAVRPEKAQLPEVKEYEIGQSCTKQYITAVCRNEKQARAALSVGADRICAPQNVLDKLPGDVFKITLCGGVGAKTSGKRVMVMNLAQASTAKNAEMFGGFRLNVANSDSAHELKNMRSVCLSPELSLKDIAKVAAPNDTEVIAYGRLPLMLMRRCPAHGVCRGDGGFSLRDRRGEEFPLMCGEGCTSELVNSKPIYMADKLEELRNAGINGLQLWFTDEASDEVKRIVSDYKNGTNEPIKNFTRGHFYRGMV